MGYGDYDFAGSLNYGSGLDSIAESYLGDLPNAYNNAIDPNGMSYLDGGFGTSPAYANNGMPNFDDGSNGMSPAYDPTTGQPNFNADQSGGPGIWSKAIDSIGGLAGLSKFGLNALAAVGPLATALLNRKPGKTGPEFPRLSGHASPFYSFQQAGPKPLSLAGSIPATQHDPLAEYLKLVQGLRG